LEDCPDKWYFNMAAFDGVFNAHHVSGESRKHRLTEAGLVIDTKRRVGEKQYRLWKRKGAFVNAGAGNKSIAHFEGAKKPLAEAAIVKRF
jgi:hypothetical protein